MTSKGIREDTPFEAALHRTVQYLFPKNCFEELFFQFNIFHDECVRLVLSRFLGLGITVGALFIFIPQIIKIYRGKSGAGISLFSRFLDLTCVIATAGYSYASGYTFSQWGDSLFITVQNAIIICQLFYYQNRSGEMMMFLVAYVAVFGAIALGWVPFAVLMFLQTATIPIVIVARTLQIHSNYSNRSTGALSIISVFLQFAGCTARIFTSVQETGDQLVVFTYVVASMLNGIIFGQMLFYWGSKPTKKME